MRGLTSLMTRAATSCAFLTVASTASPRSISISYASLTKTYDQRGFNIEIAYFSVDGQPTLNDEGVAKIAYAYDFRGNQTEERFSGVDGRAAASTDGCARQTNKYDGRGLEIEYACYGLDGKRRSTVRSTLPDSRRFVIAAGS